MVQSSFLIPEETLIQFIVEGDEVVIKHGVQYGDIQFVPLYLASVHTGLRKHARDMRIQEARVVLIYEQLMRRKGVFVPIEYSLYTEVTILRKNWFGRDKPYQYIDSQFFVSVDEDKPRISLDGDTDLAKTVCDNIQKFLNLRNEICELKEALCDHRKRVDLDTAEAQVGARGESFVSDILNDDRPPHLW